MPSVLRREFDIQGDWLAHSPSADVTITSLTIPGPVGDIACEVHRPRDANSNEAPMLIFYHGGGHVAGSLQSHRNLCRQLAYDANCVLLAVDYRLAPEHKFPVGINDCLAAYDYVCQNHAALGINPKRISVGGDSAGGNAAAVVAQQRKTAEHAPKFQILWVPWVDMTYQRPSYESVGRGFFLEKVMMEWYTDQYLRTPEDGLDPLASPIFGDVTGVCPAAILVAGFDPLRDEGRDYAQKLKSEGVPTDLRLYEGAIHPFVNIAGKVPIATQAFNDAIKILRNNM